MVNQRMSQSMVTQGRSHWRTHRWIGLLTMMGLLSTSGAAQAVDAVNGTRTIGIEEKDYAIEVTVDRGFAKLVVRRTVFNESREYDQAIYEIALPSGAAAIGLRTLGSVQGKPQWFTGELLDAEVAAARYHELTGHGGHSPKDPALLSWSDLGSLMLQVFPCPPQQSKTVEYTLLMPTRYEGGAHVLDLPMLGSIELLASARLHAARPGDEFIVNGKSIESKQRILLEWEHRVELHPKGAAQIDGAFAAVAAGPEKALNRWRFELAPQISTVPKKARLVIVLDTSRSMGEERLAAAADAARAYLSHFGDAEVELITFAREPERRFGRFVSANEAVSVLAEGAFKQGNGSQVEDVLEDAGKLLRGTSARAARRVLLLTDTLTRSSFSLDRLNKALAGSGALLHIGDVHVGRPSLWRNDDHPWSSAARRGGGLMWAAAAGDGGDVALTRAVFEEWARPIRLDHVALRAPGIDTEALAVPEALAEGEGLAHLEFTRLPAPWVELSGELWSRPVTHVLRPNAAESKRWAALIFGTEEYSELSESEMRTLARRGGAVSPVTSYLAIEPGVRPSIEGFTDDELGDVGTLGHGAGTAGGAGGMGGHRGWDFEGILRDLIGAEWKACGGTPEGAEVTLETTLGEIVDVGRVKLDQADAARESCLREAVWNLTLDERFTEGWREFVVRV